MFPFPVSDTISNMTLQEAITHAGAASGLQIALDAGDIASYTGSGQKWLDTSGNGYDFFFGEDGTVEAAKDPSFNGVAGNLSINEYMEFDGTEYFRYDTSPQPATFDDMHQENATYTIINVGYYPDPTSEFKVCGTRNLPGIEFSGRSISTINGSSAILNQGGADSAPAGLWAFSSVTIDEAGGDVSFFTLDGAYNQVSASNTFDASFTAAASTGVSGNLLSFGSSGIPTDETAAGTRHAINALWNVALTKTQIDTIFNAIRARWSI